MSQLKRLKPHVIGGTHGMDHKQFLYLSDTVKDCIRDLRDAESYGETMFSSYTTGNIADLIEEQHGVINDLMFENESKQNRILKLQEELQQTNEALNKALSELKTENNCEYCIYFQKYGYCDIAGSGKRLMLNGVCYSWTWHGL
jgi:hypothetical protein